MITSFTNSNDAWTPSIDWHFRKLLHREPSQDSDDVILFAMSDDGLMLTTQDSGPMAIVRPDLSVLPRGPSLGCVWFVLLAPSVFQVLLAFSPRLLGSASVLFPSSYFSFFNVPGSRSPLGCHLALPTHLSNKKHPSEASCFELIPQ